MGTCEHNQKSPRQTWLEWLCASLAQLVPSANANECARQGVILQVLGSGGAELTPGRASSRYLIWQDGRARVLVDAGAGSALRFAESGARFEDLDLILLTHLHVDHGTDLAAVEKASYFGTRERPLPVLGPAAEAPFHSTTGLLVRLFGAQSAFAYLQDDLPGDQPLTAGAYALQPLNIQPGADTALTVVHQADGLKITAASVRHGILPALSWRADIGNSAIMFSGDTEGSIGTSE